MNGKSRTTTSPRAKNQIVSEAYQRILLRTTTGANLAYEFGRANGAVDSPSIPMGTTMVSTNPRSDWGDKQIIKDLSKRSRKSRMAILSNNAGNRLIANYVNCYDTSLIPGRIAILQRVLYRFFSELISSELRVQGLWWVYGRHKNLQFADKPRGDRSSQFIWWIQRNIICLFVFPVVIPLFNSIYPFIQFHDHKSLNFWF